MVNTRCIPCYTTYSQSNGKGSSKHVQQPRQHSRDQPAEESSPKQANMNSASKEFAEQPGYSMRPAEDRGITEQQPDSLEEQDDRPQVECTDDETVSSLGVVCYHCLSELSVWKNSKSSGSCEDPSHNKVNFPSMSVLQCEVKTP